MTFVDAVHTRPALERAVAPGPLGDLAFRGRTVRDLAPELLQFGVEWHDGVPTVHPATAGAQQLLASRSGPGVRRAVEAMAQQVAFDGAGTDAVLRGVSLSTTQAQFGASMLLTGSKIPRIEALLRHDPTQARDVFRYLATVASGKTVDWVDLGPDVTRWVLRAARAGGPLLTMPVFRGRGTWSPRDLVHDLVHESDHAAGRIFTDPANVAKLEDPRTNVQALEEAKTELVSTWAGALKDFAARAGWPAPTGVRHDATGFYPVWSANLRRLVRAAGLDERRPDDRQAALDLLIRRSTVEVPGAIADAVATAHPGIVGLRAAALDAAQHLDDAGRSQHVARLVGADP